MQSHLIELFFLVCSNFQAMIECAYVLEDYPALEQFILQLPSGSGK